MCSCKTQILSQWSHRPFERLYNNRLFDSIFCWRKQAENQEPCYSYRLWLLKTSLNFNSSLAILFYDNRAALFCDKIKSNINLQVSLIECFPSKHFMIYYYFIRFGIICSVAPKLLNFLFRFRLHVSNISAGGSKQWKNIHEISKADAKVKLTASSTGADLKFLIIQFMSVVLSLF